MQKEEAREETSGIKLYNNIYDFSFFQERERQQRQQERESNEDAIFSLPSSYPSVDVGGDAKT